MRYLLAAILLVGTSYPSRGEEPADICLRTHTTLRAMVESVETFRCKCEVVIDDVKAGKRTLKGTYARTADAEKFVLTRHDGTHETQTARQGKVVRSIATTGGSSRGAVAPFNGQYLSENDPWTRLGFNEFLFLETVVRAKDRTRKAVYAMHTVEAKERLSTTGTPGFVLTWKRSADDVQTYEHSPSHNSLCVRAVSTYVGQNTTSEAVRECRDITEVVSGIFLPATVVTTYRNATAGVTVRTVTVRLSDVTVNKPIPAADLTLPFPKGTAVHDAIRGQQYQTGENGEPVAPFRDLPKPVRQ